MSNIEQIGETTLSIGRTINLGNFESLRVDLSIQVVMPENATDYDTEIREMEEVLDRNVSYVINKQLGRISGKPDEDFI